MSKCYICRMEEDCKPYGPEGEMVCFDCAMAVDPIGSTKRMCIVSWGIKITEETAAEMCLQAGVMK